MLVVCTAAAAQTHDKPDVAAARLQASSTATQLDQARATLAQLKAEQRELEHSMQRIAKRARVDAQGREFSQSVIEQLHRLPRAEQLAGARAHNNAMLAEASDANLRVSDELAALADIDAAVAGRAGQASPEVAAAQRAVAEAQLLEQRRILLDVDTLQNQLIDALMASNAAADSLLQSSRSAHEELNRLLFWVPARPGREVLTELGPAVAWSVSPKNWHQALGVGLQEARRVPLLPTLAMACALTLFALRRRLKKRLQALAPARQARGAYRFAHAISALAVTAALALPGALLLWSGSMLLAAAPGSAPFALALSDALVSVSLLWVGLAAFAWLLCQGGVALAHFAWDEAAMQFVSRATRVFAMLFVPLMFVAALNGLDHSPFANRESLGRLAFVLAMAVVAGTYVRLFRRDALPMQRLRLLQPHSWLLKWHGAWLALLLAMPVGIALLALAGYFIAASYFFGRMTFTLTLVLGAMGLYGLIALWVHLQRARLAHAERQERALQAQQTTDAADAAVQAVQTPRIDIAALGEQTRSLLNLLITLLLLTGVWLIWRDAVPMLSVVSDFTLWHYEGSNVDGKAVSLPLTVGQLFLALLVAAVTALVMKNIGALLDIVLLQRLEMQADATYAVKVATGYLIVAAGIVVAAGILGIQWSDVHWLVAALGVGLGFGLQEIVANFVSGLIVLAERPIRIGDVVTVGNVTGVVSRIRARATAVVDFENKEVIIPNKAFITEQVVNWTLSNQITRLLIPVGVAYGSDIAAVQRLMLAAVRDADEVLTEPPPTVFFVGFGDSALNFEIRAYVDAFDKRLKVQHEINVAIDRALGKAGIEIPFPQRDLHIRSGPWPPAGDDAAPAASS